jgi:small-conductance mechanosensitive channel
MKKLRSIIENDLWSKIQEVLNWGFHFDVGDKQIHLTIGLILLIIGVYAATRILLKWLRRLLTRKMNEEDKLKFISVFKFTDYIIYLTVILVTLNASGINVTVILTASAALLVGLGLALQILFQDILAGIIIIVDKSVNVGDVVEVDDKVGKVFEIKLRTTRAITRDDKVVVIPNHKFITDTVYNYTQNHRTTREDIAVGVAYGSNVDKVEEILLAVAADQSGVLRNPEPFVLFEDFGDSALQFTLQFYINDSFQVPRLKSRMRFAINERFNSAGIRIPFPQRDVHLFQQGGNPSSPSVQ